MKIASFPVIVVAVALTLLGCVLLPLLPVKLYPSRALPSLQVNFAMRNASSRVVEQQVTSRLEGALARVKGVRRMESRSGNGQGSISIELDRHTDIDMARLEASTIVRQLWGELPEGVTYPQVSTGFSDNRSTLPFMTYTVVSSMNSMDIATYVEENVKPMLADIPGVGSVDLYGTVPMEWRLTYDADLLGSSGLSAADIQRAIARHYGSGFLGMGEDGKGWLRLVRKAPGDRSEFDASLITLTTPRGERMTLDKLVRVVRTESVPGSYFRINGMNAIYLNITASDEANQLEVGKRVRESLAALESKLPAGLSFILSNDNTESISGELDKIYFRSGLTVLILLLFIVLMTRNLRYTLLIVISLAINLGVAVIFYYLFHTEIQLYSLAGITISLNLIIDNTIVMCDHYMRHRDRKAFPALLAATLTTVGALVVVFFLNEDVRRNLEDFVIVVVVNLLVSLLVALLLVPALAERMDMRRRKPEGARGRRRMARHLLRCYGAYVRFALRWRWAFLLLMAGAIGGSGWLFFKEVREGDYFNREERERSLHVTASLPNGATLSQMDALMRKMEAYLSGFDGVRQFQTHVMNGRQASMDIFFTRSTAYTGFPYRLKSDIISKALTLGGGSWSVSGLEDMGFNNDVRERAGSTLIRMYGFNYDRLWDYALEMRDSLLAHKKIKEVELRSDFSFWQEDYTEFTLDIDREALVRDNLTVYDFYQALSNVFGRDINCGYIVNEGNSERITLSSRQGADYDIWALMNTPFRVGDRMLRISDVATFEKNENPQDIVKENQSYRICLQYEYIGSYNQGKRVKEEKIEAMEKRLSPGYSIQNVEQGWNQDKEGYERYMVLGIIVLIIFFLSAILFNSLLKPLAIIAVIPMSYVGIFLTFWWFGLKFDQGGFASFILLSGITVNAAIYIINEMGYRRGVAAYLAAFRVKCGPVIMTVLSTVLGFIPFIVGTERESFWFALAAGTIGGLLFSLPALLLYLPLLILRRKYGRAAARPYPQTESYRCLK